jgi:signal transduction protein with GAF and PtsI domain
VSVLRILTIISVIFAGLLAQAPPTWAEEKAEETQASSPQRQITGTGKTAGVAAGQTVGKKGFLSRNLILGAIALAALAAVALEASSDNDKAPGPGATSPTTSTTTTSGTGG